MNRAITISIAFGFLVLALSNFSLDKKTSFIMTTLTEEPVLPEIPYVYTVEEIPDYLADPDTNPVPYYVAEVQTTAITEVEDNIATLGRVLFYDKKLSAMENISCGTCHDQSLSFAENKPLSEGIASNTQRNSMHLNDLGWSNSRRFSWDMEQTSLKDMIVLPLTDGNEIGASEWDLPRKLEGESYYKELFGKAYGEQYITIDRIVDALEQFIVSMNTFNSKFDQHAPTAFQNFTESEKRGMSIFQQSCTTCHRQGNTSTFGTPPPPNATNNNGLPPDPEDIGGGDWDDRYDGLFKLTTMRNIELTAPYMHDGRFETLEEVIEHYSSEVVDNEHTSQGFIPDGGYDFTDQEKADLLNFMKTLTDNTFISNPKWSDPFAESSSSTSGVLQFENLRLKPNPMSDRAVIEFKNDRNELVSINILSSDGRLIKHDSTTSNKYELEKSTFETGIYYVQLIRDDAKSVQKLIVQ